MLVLQILTYWGQTELSIRFCSFLLPSQPAGTPRPGKAQHIFRLHLDSKSKQFPARALLSFPLIKIFLPILHWEFQMSKSTAKPAMPWDVNACGAESWGAQWGHKGFGCSTHCRLRVSCLGALSGHNEWTAPSLIISWTLHLLSLC